MNKALYDAYIKAFRWSTDRLNDNNENGGIICFVSNGAWLDGNSTDGFRKTIESEFSAIYVLNLRGNQRTSGELSRKEGGKIFGGGSRAPIAITLLVKKPGATTDRAKIFYHDIGDYLDREKKLAIIKNFKSFGNALLPLKEIIPNEHGDWLAVRQSIFGDYLPLAPDKKFDRNSQSFFSTYAIGISTNRDAWVYNFSIEQLIQNCKSTILFYNDQISILEQAIAQNPDVKIDEVVSADPTKISWTVNLKKDLSKLKNHNFNLSEIRTASYRPFLKQKLYFDKALIERPGLALKFFPNEKVENMVISVTGEGNLGFSVLISDSIVDLCYTKSGNGGGQVFPLYFFEKSDAVQKGLFDNDDSYEFLRHDGITDFILERAKKQYGKNVNKLDIFYYVYGFLHNKDYQKAFADDLKKTLPRLPLVEDVRDFWAFNKVGKKLADLHLNFEAAGMHARTSVTGIESDYFVIEKMRFQDKKIKDTIIYNSKVSISNIPSNAYEYEINGKSAIEWVMEKYQPITHKESGLLNDPNLWLSENGNSRKILDLLLCVINVSVQTIELTNSLPTLSFDLESSAIEIDQNIDNLDELLSNHEPQAEVMREFSLNEGIYFIADVVQITRLNRDKVSRWFKELSKENYEGLTNSQQNDTAKMRISFYGLIELVVIGTLRDAGFTLKKILTARQDLKNITHKIYPFATNNVRDDLKVAGNAILFELTDGIVTLNGTSQFNLDIIKTFFANIVFDTEGLAQQLFPVKDSKLIVVDPKLGGGKAVINNGGGVWAETIASAYDGPDSIAMLESQYDVTRADVLAAVAFLN